MESDSNIEKVLLAYFNGQANADDIKKLLGWLDQSPANKKHFEVLQDFWKNSNFKISIKDQDEAFNRIQENIDLQHPNLSNVQWIEETKRSSGSSFIWFKGMAAAFLVMAMAISFYFITSEKNSNAISEKVPVLLKSQNRSGEKSKIRLADGTVAWLNSESILEYPREFGDERLVKLKGEAFFEIANDTLKPFKVSSGNIVTTALGTSFNVQYFQDENEIVISLVTGKIKISLDTEETYFLDPGFQFSYNRIEKSVDKKKIDVNNAIAWKDGVLIFDKDNYQSVVKKLQRWYGVHINTRGVPPSDFIITGQIRKNESLDLTLETIKYGRHFDYQIDGKEIEIMFN